MAGGFFCVAIIEAELTKAQFDLLISELRATIQFV
jgi:hypothetical protein